jgi:hypothetical protein
VFKLQVRDPQAQYELGLSLSESWGPTSPDWRKERALGIHYLDAAAEQGHVEAQFTLGLEYEKQSNLPHAWQWMTKAAGQGHAGAQAWLTERRFDVSVFLPENIGALGDLSDSQRRALLVPFSTRRTGPSGRTSASRR